MGDDDIRFHIDLGEAGMTGASLAKPVARDQSFRIGGIARPNAPASPASPPVSAPARTRPVVTQGKRSPREPLCYISFRIHRATLRKLDEMAAERGTSASQIMRTIMDNATRRKRQRK